MSEFYDQLSRVYDIVFPENKGATAFLAKDLGDGKRILDLACGTGNYTCALAGMGHEVCGVDLDSEMIIQARRKCPDSRASFYADDMLAVDRLFPGGGFDLAFCIGNSIVHLPDRDAVGAMCRTVAVALAPGGSFVVQIVNFDRIMAHDVHSLPPLERKEAGVTLIRNYGFAPGDKYVSFDTELIVDGVSAANSVRLMALMSGELTGILEASGFSRTELYGGYDGSEHTDKSPATVVRAWK